jgi:hypothetical protein
MNNTIHIPEPCSEKWASMKNIGKGQRHCEVCKHTVHDFYNSSLQEINQKINSANGEKVCGKYHERHTTTNKKVYVLVNKIENRLMMFRLKRFSILLVTAILFLSGCARRRATMGAYSKFSDTKNKMEQTLQAKL